MADLPHPKIAQPDHAIHDLIQQRWSPRAFAEREVPDAVLWRLFEAARWAPSSRNEQPWRFVLARRHHGPNAFASLLAALSPGNQSWAAAAPVLALVVVRTTHERDEQANSHAWYDAGQAVSLLTMQATVEGLGVRQMQGFAPDKAREACQVPEPFIPAVVMAIGYPGDPGALPNDAHRVAELTPRTRHPTADLVFDGVWGTPMR